jgi:hypothetical protein
MLTGEKTLNEEARISKILILLNKRYVNLWIYVPSCIHLSSLKSLQLKCQQLLRLQCWCSHCGLFSEDDSSDFQSSIGMDAVIARACSRMERKKSFSCYDDLDVRPSGFGRTAATVETHVAEWLVDADGQRGNSFVCN